MRIKPVDEDQASEAARPVYEQLKQRSGRVPNFYKMFGHKPELLRTFVPFYQALWAPGALAPKLKELAYLRVSILNGCEY